MKEPIQIPTGVISKSEFRQLFKLTTTYANILLNVDLFEELEKLKYKKSQRLLYPIQLAKIIELYGTP